MDLAPIGVERPAEPGSVFENDASAALDGWVVVGEIAVEQGMLGEQSKAQCRESVASEIDDDELWSDEQAPKLVGG